MKPQPRHLFLFIRRPCVGFAPVPGKRRRWRDQRRLQTGATPPGTPPDTKNNFSVSLISPAVPEPTTIALMGVGGLLMLAPYLRRKTRKLADAV